MTQFWDAIVVGAGPAGLTAALYLARFRRSTLVLHDGTSRAARIPTHNVPRWAEGISGARLLARIAAQARKYGASFLEAHVERVEKSESGFTVATSGEATSSSRALLLATGANLNQIPLEAQDHETALVNRILGYCPICNGFEHIDQRIGVVGCDRAGREGSAVPASIFTAPHLDAEKFRRTRPAAPGAARCGRNRGHSEPGQTLSRRRS